MPLAICEVLRLLVLRTSLYIPFFDSFLTFVFCWSFRRQTSLSLSSPTQNTPSTPPTLHFYHHVLMKKTWWKVLRKTSLYEFLLLSFFLSFLPFPHSFGFIFVVEIIRCIFNLGNWGWRMWVGKLVRKESELEERSRAKIHLSDL